jgi:hypothetical protein
MCDYSLERQQSRPAVAGDRLVTTAFPGSTTIGFATPAEPDTAICLLPGTELVFDEPVMFSGLFSFLLQAHHHDCLTARFRQVNTENHFVHHDALEFGNGQIVLLTHLRPGQHASVLQLPVVERAENTEPLIESLVSAPALVR